MNIQTCVRNHFVFVNYLGLLQFRHHRILVVQLIEIWLLQHVSILQTLRSILAQHLHVLFLADVGRWRLLRVHFAQYRLTAVDIVLRHDGRLVLRQLIIVGHCRSLSGHSRFLVAAIAARTAFALDALHVGRFAAQLGTGGFVRSNAAVGRADFRLYYAVGSK